MISKPRRVEFPLLPIPHSQPVIPLAEIAARRFDLIDRITPEEYPMLDRHDERTVTALVDEVLAALRTNLEEHKEIVEEARAGYIDKAQEALNRRLGQLREGKLVALDFRLTPPQDHSKDFRTAIKMMELHKASWEAQPGGVEKNGPATFELKALDVQRFVLNDWSWMDAFLLSNSAYSGKAAMLYEAKQS